jgi:hypothetical protein
VAECLQWLLLPPHPIDNILQWFNGEDWIFQIHPY